MVILKISACINDIIILAFLQTGHKKKSHLLQLSSSGGLSSSTHSSNRWVGEGREVGGGLHHSHETWMPKSYSSSSQGFWMHLGTVKIGIFTRSGENVRYSTHHWGLTVSC